MGDDRKVVKENAVGNSIEFEFRYRSYELGPLKDWVDNAIKGGATHFQWDACGSDCGTEDLDLQAYRVELESDEQVIARREKQQASERARQAKAKADRKRQYDKLKAEFESA